MKRFLITLALLCPLAMHAQTPNIQWQKSYGGSAVDQASAIRPTNDGGYIVTGHSLSTDGDVVGNHGSSDYWVLKLDNAGAVQWKKTYGGTLDDRGYDIRQTLDGGYVLSGLATSNNGDVSGNNGGQDFWIVKLDPLGTIEWQNALGGSGVEQAYAVWPTMDSGYAALGLTTTTNGTGDVIGNNGGQEWWMTKLNSAGALMWAKCLGSTTADQGFGMQQTTDGGYILSGTCGGNSGMVTGNHGGADMWMVKLDSLGTLQWQKSFGGSLEDRSYGVCQAADGGFVGVGITNSVDGDVTGFHGGASDVWVVKVNSAGALQWQKTLGGTGDDNARSVRPTEDGGLIVGARTNTANNGDVSGHHGDFDYWMIKLDSVGNLTWQKAIGGSGREGIVSSVHHMSAEQLADGSYVMAGSTVSTDGDAVGNTSASSSDDNYWIVKLGACPNYTSLVDTICDGTSILFNGTLIAASGSYTDTLVSASGCDSFIVLSLYVRPALAPVVTANGFDLSTGTFASYVWLLDGVVIPGAIAQNHTAVANGNYSVVVTDVNGCVDTSAVLGITGVGVNDVSFSDNVKVYPNPVKGSIGISLPSVTGQVSVSICTVDGRTVFAGTYKAANTLSIPVGNLASGLYMLRVTDEANRTAIRKVVKE